MITEKYDLTYYTPEKKTSYIKKFIKDFGIKIYKPYATYNKQNTVSSCVLDIFFK